MKLLTFSVQPSAIIAESVSAGSWFPFILWYVTTRRTRTIVMMNTICGLFFNLVNGIEDSRCGHGISPSWYKLYSELWTTIFKN